MFCRCVIFNHQTFSPQPASSDDFQNVLGTSSSNDVSLVKKIHEDLIAILYDVAIRQTDGQTPSI